MTDKSEQFIACLNEKKEVLNLYNFNVKKRERIENWIEHLSNQKNLDELDEELYRSLQDTLQKQQGVCQRELSKLMSLVRGITDDFEADVIRLKYIHDLNFSEIASRLGYSERQIYRIHKEALEKLNIPK